MSRYVDTLPRNLTMLTDLYQLTMMHGYLKNGDADKISVFDMFFRRTLPNTSYALLAGLEQVVEYIDNLRFTEQDFDYLRSLKLFDEDFFDALRDLRFTGDFYAIPEGTVVFPNEPLIRVKAPMLQAQLIETALLNIINHQTLIATKASRVVHAAGGSGVLEFGLRRAQGPDAGIYGARAAIIGGCEATSNVLTGQMFDIPVRGTHSHSWVMNFPDEVTAFRAYANVFPDSSLFLVDTYDTLKSGVPNAITVFKELREKGHKPVGIRLDSGDLAYLSRQARDMMDAAGFEDAKIFASSDLDEELIHDLRSQGARIDVWGVGTKLITGVNWPALGGVYKLSAQQEGGVIVPKIKKSDNPAKITNPGYKKVMRLYGNHDGKAIADLIMLENETLNTEQPLTIFHPVDTWKRTIVTDFSARDLLQPVYIGGEKLYKAPTLSDIRSFARQEMDTFWDTYKRFKNPQEYKVDLSDALYVLKRDMLTAL